MTVPPIQLGHVIVVESITERSDWSVEHPDDCPDAPDCMTAKVIASPFAHNPVGVPNVPGPGRWRLLQITQDATGRFQLYVEKIEETP